MSDPSPPSDEASSTTRVEALFLVTGVLLCIAGATLGVDAIGRSFADDGKVNHGVTRLGIEGFRIVLAAAGIATVFARRALARLRSARVVAWLAVAFSGAGAGVGACITGAPLIPEPWQRPGVDMKERLELLSVAKAGFFGPAPETMKQEIPEGETFETGDAHFRVGYACVIRGRHEDAAVEFKRSLEILRKLPLPSDKAAAAEQIALEDQAEKELSGCYLRMGETENCIKRHCCDSCIFPIAGGGIHQAPNGSRLAMEVLKNLFESDPTDLTSKWLYNVAAMTVGDYPDGVPGNLLAPPELFRSEAPMPRFPDRAAAIGVAADGLAGGAILEDFDGDGDVDLVSSSQALHDTLRYFRNEGDGSFREMTKESGLDGFYGGLSISQGDYDNDGDPDISIVRGAWMKDFGTLPMSLIRNNGDGTFTDVTENAGLLSFFPGQVAEWADYDNDGWVDLFVGHETTPEIQAPTFLFHNNRDGTFSDVRARTAIAEFGFVKGAAWGDFDNDGWIDLYVSQRLEPSHLYRNVAAAGGGRTFVDVTAKAGIEGTYNSFASWFFDFDNDGDLDLWTSTYGNAEKTRKKDPWREPVAEIGPVLLQSGKNVETCYSRLYRNNGDSTFTNVAEEMGLHRVVLVMGSNFGDLDMDGWLDLYLGTGNPSFRALIPNKAFRNDHGRRFQDVTTATGLGHLQKGHAIAFADVDNDGDEDVYADMGGFFPGDNFANALYENPGSSNHWVTLRLHGTQTNKRAIGARIKVALETPQGRRDLHRVVGASSSFGSSSVQQEVGLGDATAIASISVYWPVSRTTQTFEGVAMDRVVDLTEGDPKARVTEAHPFKLKCDAADCCPPKSSQGSR